ncbi:DUF1996 domain-containing protein [Mycena kentingensis (nom. inval.)]|nr:DUF1996 domain-containing protein [Mycena kentingensis (nom. inval.)]
MVFTARLVLAAVALSGVQHVSSYFLFGMSNTLTTERIDPIVSPGVPASHTHTVFGGSGFGVTTSTEKLRASECTTSPIKEDKSVYWVPTLHFQWKNGSFSSVDGGAVMIPRRSLCYLPAHHRLDYLFSNKAGATTPFPANFKMISGTPTLRTYDASSAAQQAVTFLCLDFNGQSTKHNELPTQDCPSGVRAQLNFPSCWNGVDLDSADHKSHVAYLSGGPDSGECLDPKFPKTLPRIFMEVYLDTVPWWKIRDQAMNPNQPFVYAMGDAVGYGYHGDFFMGWDDGVLDKVVDKCNCNDFGDPTCCAQQGLFTYTKDTHCRITKGVDEQTTGLLPKLPGNNPVTGLGGNGVNPPASEVPALISPVYAYTGDSPSQTGKPVGAGTTIAGGGGASSSAVGGGASSSAVVGGASSSAVVGGASSSAVVGGASSSAVDGGASSSAVVGGASSSAVDGASSPTDVGATSPTTVSNNDGLSGSASSASGSASGASTPADATPTGTPNNGASNGGSPGNDSTPEDGASPSDTGSGSNPSSSSSAGSSNSGYGNNHAANPTCGTGRKHYSRHGKRALRDAITAHSRRSRFGNGLAPDNIF